METNNIVEWSDLDVLFSCTSNNTVGDKIVFYSHLQNNRDFEVRVAPKLSHRITEYYEDKNGFRYNESTCMVTINPASQYLTIPPNSRIEVFRHTTTIIISGYLTVRIPGLFEYIVKIND